MARTKQHEIPEGFARLWRVGGAPWETPYAQQIGELIGYTRDDDGRDLVMLRFCKVDTEGATVEHLAAFTPWQLFPVDAAAGGRPERARLRRSLRRRSQEGAGY